MTRQVENFNACPERQPQTVDNLCKDIYTPENRNQFCGTKKPELNCNTDDDFNSYFSENLNQNIYEGGCSRPGDDNNNKYLKNVDRGQKYLDRASTDLEQALSALDNGNSRGARHEIEEALRRSGKAVDQFGTAVERHRGGGANGAYGEDSLKDGSREISGSREEMKQALDLLKSGKTGEAYESIREALKGLKSGGEEVQAGEDSLRGRRPVNTARGREAASDREFREGAKQFDRAGDALEDALNSLDHGSKDGAMRDLERSHRNLDLGQNNYKDGLRLNQSGDESGIKKGLETSKTVDQSIDAAMDLLKAGCTREAKQVIQEALKRLEKSSDQLAEGVDKQDDLDFRPDDCVADRNRGRDIDFPRNWQPTNPNWRDRINVGNGDRIGLFPGEFGITNISDKFNPLDPAGLLDGRNGGFNPLDPIGLFDRGAKNGGFNPLDPAGLLGGKDGGFNPLDPIGLFDKGGKNGGFNPLDPAGLLGGKDGGFNPLDPVGLFNKGGKDGGFNPLDPAGLLSSNDGAKSSPLDILNPIKVTKKIFGGLFG